jgi:DNA mismatch endonuclease, patch repair protein
MPKTRRGYWEGKFAANIARDSKACQELAALGWRVITIWECQTKPSVIDMVMAAHLPFIELQEQRSGAGKKAQ